MKTYPRGWLILSSCCLLLAASSVRAGADRAPETLWRAKDLGRWSVRLGHERHDRGVRYEGDLAGAVEARITYAMVSYDAQSWLTLSAGAGAAEARPDGITGYGDAETSWGLAARLNLWQYDVLSPTFLASRLKLTADTAFWSHEAEVLQSGADWFEWRSTLAIGAECFVREWGLDKTVYPYSITYQVGIVHSLMDGEIPVAAGTDGSAAHMDFEQDDAFGWMVSADLKLAHNLSVGWTGLAYQTPPDEDDFVHVVDVSYHF